MGIGVLFVLAARRALLPHAGGDMWLHLRLGAEFAADWNVRAPGHLGPFDSADWVPTQWLAQVAMSAVERSFGLGGVLWLAASAHIVVLSAIYFLCRRVAAPLPSTLTTVVALFSLAPWLTARPQVLSYLFVAILVRAWVSTAMDGRVRYWTVLLIWLWVPLHGMWPVGIALSAALSAGVALDQRARGLQLLRLAAVPLGALLLAMVTPLGWRAYAGVAVVSSRNRYFEEWAPPDFTALSSVGASLMAALVIQHLVRRGRATWTETFLLGSGILFAVLSTRTVPVAAVVLAPLFAQTLQIMVPKAGPVGRTEVASLITMAAVVLSFLALVSPARGTHDVVPTWLDDRLDAAPAGTRVLNDWDSGAYFLWRHPQLDLVMHGYGDVFTDDELARNAGIMRLRPRWDEDVAGLSVDFALVDPESPLAYALKGQGWTTREGDDEFLILQPPADLGDTVGQ